MIAKSEEKELSSINAKVIVIAAVGLNGEIGFRHRLPWSIPEEMRMFRDVTLGSCVIMGRRTFQSISQPLDKRFNIVISRSLEKESLKHFADTRVARSLREAFDLAPVRYKKLFIIGGFEVYQQALPLANELWISKVEYEGEADTFFPYIEKEIWSEQHVSSHQSSAIGWHFYKYKRR